MIEICRILDPELAPCCGWPTFQPPPAFHISSVAIGVAERLALQVSPGLRWNPGCHGSWIGTSTKLNESQSLLGTHSEERVI